jgi:hypothetical protein
MARDVSLDVQLTAVGGFPEGSAVAGIQVQMTEAGGTAFSQVFPEGGPYTFQLTAGTWTGKVASVDAQGNVFNAAVDVTTVGADGVATTSIVIVDKVVTVSLNVPSQATLTVAP